MNDPQQRPWQIVCARPRVCVPLHAYCLDHLLFLQRRSARRTRKSCVAPLVPRLARNTELGAAAYRSLLLAFISSPIAALLGTSAGIALARLEHFPGRSMMIALLAIPIFAPEILLGFSFLILFASVQALTGWSHGKGMLTLVIAHATLGAPIVAAVVFARVSGRDRSLEDAARDLGARPLRSSRPSPCRWRPPVFYRGGCWR